MFGFHPSVLHVSWRFIFTRTLYTIYLDVFSATFQGQLFSGLDESRVNSHVMSLGSIATQNSNTLWFNVGGLVQGWMVLCQENSEASLKRNTKDIHLNWVMFLLNERESSHQNLSLLFSLHFWLMMIRVCKMIHLFIHLKQCTAPPKVNCGSTVTFGGNFFYFQNWEGIVRCVKGQFGMVENTPLRVKGLICTNMSQQVNGNENGSNIHTLT